MPSSSTSSPTFAVIADIHGNLPALEAVLNDLAVVRPDAIYFAGDFVNRGPQSGAVVERAMVLGLPAISGNHDTWLAAMVHGKHIPGSWEDSWWTPQRLAVGELTPTLVGWIDALPARMRIELPGAAPVLLVHGSPRSSREGMGHKLSDEQAAEVLSDVEERAVIAAHIHYPLERRVNGTHVVVIGAVGCPFNRDINAQYGLFTWDGDDWRFEHRSVPYDHEPLYAAWRESGYLADNSLSAELMLLEHQTARTHYVPFWDWCVAHDLPLTRANYERFAGDRE
ncbi:MAG TPA: metallophosphoesterase [Ktedonobacterales bacterium]|nr:metallophosphoesterase [Ktedonobacterales bacterium]